MGRLTNTVSGDIASFRSAAYVPIESLKCHFKPKQSFNGYDKPWPTGGGKNKLNPATWLHSNNPFVKNGVTFTLNEDGTVLVNGTATDSDTTAGFRIIVNEDTDFYFCANASENGAYEVYIWDVTLNSRAKQWDGTTDSLDSRASQMREVKLLAGHDNIFFIRVVSGITANNVLFKPMLISATETDATFIPYENICPIEGWNQIALSHTQRNLFDINTLNMNDGTYSVTVTNGVAIGTMQSFQKLTAPSQNRQLYLQCPIDTTKTITFKMTAYTENNMNLNTLGMCLATKCVGESAEYTWWYNTDTTAKTLTKTIPIGKTLEYFYISYSNGYNNIWHITNLQVEYNNQNIEYEKYHRNLYPITFPSTGNNKLNPSTIIINNNSMKLVNGIYKNTIADTRTQLDIYTELWKDTSTFIKNKTVRYNAEIGRINLTITIDDETAQYIAVKHNGSKYDFRLIFPIPDSNITTYTLSMDILNNDTLSVGGVQFANLQLEAGDIAHKYEPYFYNNSTVYGGYIDLINGELWKTHEFITFNGSENWTLYPHETYGNSYWIAINEKKIKEHSSLCNIYKNVDRSYGSNGNSQYGIFCDHESLKRLYFKAPNSSITTLEEFKAWLVTHNLKVTYELENPQLVTTLNSIQLKTFLGYNNIWSNTNGQVEVEYDLHETQDIIECKKRVLLAQPHLATVKNSIAHFNTDMNVSLKQAIVEFLPIQYGSGDPTSTNIRPITGWISIQINHSGKNMLKCDGYGNGTAGGVTFTKHTNENNIIDYITCSGTTTSTNAFRNLNYTVNVNKIPRGTVSVNSFSNQANIALLRPDNITDNSVRFYSSDDGAGTAASRTGWFNYNTDKFDEYMGWARIQIWPNAKNTEIDTIVYPMMCHIDDRGCEYEPYYGTIDTISWENDYGTIYGGYIDLITGKLVVEWVKEKIKNLTVGLTSNATTAWHNWFVNLPYEYKMIKDFDINICPIICDTFLATPQSGGSLSQDQTKPIVWASSTEGNLRFKYIDDCALTAAEFKTKYGETEIAYKLATPIEYNLTPMQINPFIGANNIWSNTNGDLKIKYWTH